MCRVERPLVNSEPSVCRRLCNVRVPLQWHACAFQRAVNTCHLISYTNNHSRTFQCPWLQTGLELIWISGYRSTNHRPSVIACYSTVNLDKNHANHADNLNNFRRSFLAHWKAHRFSARLLLRKWLQCIRTISHFGGLCRLQDYLNECVSADCRTIWTNAICVNMAGIKYKYGWD